MENKNIDIIDIAKLLCAHKIRIKGDKNVIEGHPKDLARKFELGKFIKALEKYIPEDKVEVIWKPEGKEFIKYLQV